ncbi:MAG: PIN domain-containing protein, partial [Solirubrobacteraceae bacterium]
MAKATHLVDNSVLARIGEQPVVERVAPMIVAGLVATCSVTDLELLFSARSGEEHHARRADLELRFEHVQITQAVLDRAVAVQGLLAEKGEHRAASIPDLILAAAAEEAMLTVLHHKADFELIATVMRLQAEWVLPHAPARATAHARSLHDTIVSMVDLAVAPR